MGKAAKSKTAIVQCVVPKGGQRKGRDINHLLSLEGILEAGTLYETLRGTRYYQKIVWEQSGATSV